MDEQLLGAFADFLKQFSVAPGNAALSEEAVEELYRRRLSCHVIEHVPSILLAPAAVEKICPAVQVVDSTQSTVYAGCLEAAVTARMTPIRLRVSKGKRAAHSVAVPFCMPTRYGPRVGFGCILEVLPRNALGLRIDPVLMHYISPPSELLPSVSDQSPMTLSVPLLTGRLSRGKSDNLQRLQRKLTMQFINKSAYINILRLPHGHGPKLSDLFVRTRRLPGNAQFFPLKPFTMAELRLSQQRWDSEAHNSAAPVVVINLVLLRQSWLVSVLFELEYRLIERPLWAEIPHLWDTRDRCFVFIQVSELGSVRAEMICPVHRLISVIVGSGNDMARMSHEQRQSYCMLRMRAARQRFITDEEGLARLMSVDRESWSGCGLESDYSMYERFLNVITGSPVESQRLLQTGALFTP